MLDREVGRDEISKASDRLKGEFDTTWKEFHRLLEGFAKGEPLTPDLRRMEIRLVNMVSLIWWGAELRRPDCFVVEGVSYIIDGGRIRLSRHLFISEPEAPASALAIDLTEADAVDAEGGSGCE